MAGSRRSDRFRLIPDRTLAAALVLLALPAFLIHLDVIAFIGDEGIRALVAFEMDRSGDYIVPTLNGELYFNKPPLYNWMILGVSKVFGYFGEWPSRITTLLCLAAFALIAYHYARKYSDRTTALTLAAMLLTSGRILFWDSMLGLIDIAFSAVVFLNFMLLYDLGRRDRWHVLWPASYALFAVAFLLKGLPAVVFQAISVAVALTFFNRWRSQAISRAHFLGIATGLAPLALYYGLYASRVDLDEVFAVLVDQSLQRTPTHHTAWETITHLFNFAPEQVYHFLPWSLLVAVAFHPSFRRLLRERPVVHFSFWMLVANLPVYWISAQVYPRYLLMFVPLFNVIGLYMLSTSPLARWSKIYRGVFLVLNGAAFTGVLLMPLIDIRVTGLSAWPWIMPAGVIGLGVTFLGLWHDRGRAFLWMALMLLVVRIVFNLVVLPLRSLDWRENLCREDCRRAAAAHADAPWYVYGETFTGEVARFYTSVYTGRIIAHVDDVVDTSGYYIVDRPLNRDFPGIQVDSLLLENRQVFAIMRPLPPEPPDTTEIR